MTPSIQDLLNQLSPVDTDEMKRMTKAKKLSAAFKGKPLSEERKAVISAAFKGKPLSEERKAVISARLKGKSLSEEHRAAIASGLKGNVRPESVGVSIKTAYSAKRYSRFEKDWDILEAAIADPVMSVRGNRINWDATSEKYGLPSNEISAFLSLRKAGKL